MSKIFVNVIAEGAAGCSSGLARRMFLRSASVPSVLKWVTGADVLICNRMFGLK